MTWVMKRKRLSRPAQGAPTIPPHATLAPANPSQPSMARPPRAGVVCVVDRGCRGVALGAPQAGGVDLPGFGGRQAGGQDRRWRTRHAQPHAGLPVVRTRRRTATDIADPAARGASTGARVASHPRCAHCGSHGGAAAATRPSGHFLICYCFNSCWRLPVKR